MRAIAVCLFHVILLLAMPARAFELVPMVASFSDSGRQSEMFFQITNSSNQPLPIEVMVKKRIMQGLENERLADTEDFFVFPPQTLVPAGKSQMVKVKYIGEPVEKASSYRIVFSQLPIKDSVEQSSIKMLFQIGALAFVTPKNVEYNLDASIAGVAPQAETLALLNTGSGVLALPEMSFNVRSGSQNASWSWEQLQPLLDRQFLVPGEQVNVPVGSLTSEMSGELSVEVKGL